jgi:capsule polysaccharide export protein KpsE/RkpR
MALGLRNPNDVFVAMLKSRTVADRLIDEFGLKSVYGLELTADVRDELAGNTSIGSGRDGVIRIDVDDHDPVRAAAIANGYVVELERLTLRLAVTDAAHRRVFFEKHLQQARRDLTAAELELKNFQESSGLILPAGQTSVTVAAAAALRAQITAKEVQLATLRAFATEQNADLIRAEQELTSLRIQLGKMEGIAGAEKGDVLVSIGKAPGVSIEYMKRYRDVKYFETLYELLAKQYELARIDEAKTAVVVQVLDAAVPPERKSKPRRTLLTLFSLLVSAIVACLIALVLESLDRSRRDPAKAARYAALRTYLGRR